MKSIKAESLTSLDGTVERSSAAEKTTTRAFNALPSDISDMGFTLMDDISESSSLESSTKRKKYQKKKKKKVKAQLAELYLPVSASSSSLSDRPISPDDQESSTPLPSTEVIVIYTDPSGRCHGAITRDGTLVVDRGNKKWFDSDSGRHYPNVIYSDQAAPTIIAKTLSIGHYLVGEATDSVAVTCSIQHARIASFKIEAQAYPQRDVLIAIPLVRKLESRFPNPYLSVSNLQAFLAVAIRDFHSLPVAMLKDSIDYFVAQAYVRRELLMSKQNVAMVNETAKKKLLEERTFVQPSTLDAQEYVTTLGQSVDHGTFYRKYADSPDMDQILLDNGNFEIKSSQGYRPHSSGSVAGMFDTLSNPFPRFYRTVFCRLVGEKDFKVLDPDGKQACYAMSRLYKAREGEETLRANQQDILRHLSIDGEMLSQCTNQIASDVQKNISDARGIDTSTPGVQARISVARFFAASGMTYFAIIANWLFYFTLFPFYIMYLAKWRWDWLVGLVGVGSSGGEKFLRKPVKSQTYIRWYVQRRFTGLLTSDDAPKERVEAKFKNELAKPNKVGRLFVTYGSSIINGGMIYSHVKSLFCRTYNLTELAKETVSEDTPFKRSNLDLQVVKSLEEGYSPTTDLPGLSARVFSDDMAATYVTESGEVIHFDADISSCDSGNTYANFYLLAILLKAYGMKDLIGQQFSRLKESITLYNPSTRAGKREFVTLRPKTIFQGSGCPETTMVNNVASTSIVIAFHTFIDYSNSHGIEIEGEEVFFDDATPHQRSCILQQAAAAVGHVITIDWWPNRAGSQFLKHSLLEDKYGTLVNTRNFGAIFRGMGQINGDLNHLSIGKTKSEFRRMSMEEKMECYMAGVVRGLCNEPSNVIMDALRDRFVPDGSRGVVIETNYLVEHACKSNRSGHYLPISSLQDRYGGEEHEWTQLAEAIQNLRLGLVIPCSLLTLFYKCDYGL